MTTYIKPPKSEGCTWRKGTPPSSPTSWKRLYKAFRSEGVDILASSLAATLWRSFGVIIDKEQP